MRSVLCIAVVSSSWAVVSDVAMSPFPGECRHVRVPIPASSLPWSHRGPRPAPSAATPGRVRDRGTEDRRHSGRLAMAAVRRARPTFDPHPRTPGRGGAGRAVGDRGRNLRRPRCVVRTTTADVQHSAREGRRSWYPATQADPPFFAGWIQSGRCCTHTLWRASTASR